MYKYEYRATGKRTGKPRLLSLEEFKGLAGFRSIFAFTEKAVKHVEDTGATRGLGKFPIMMDTLVLDFDDAPEAQTKAKKWLDKNGIGYITYTTGGRGQHIHISINKLEQVGLAHLVKATVQKLFPGADDSVYKPTGIIRLPGTYHSKTGAAMVKLEEKAGAKLDVMKYKPEMAIPVPRYHEEIDPIQLDAWLTSDLHKVVSEGEGVGRNNHLFNICATCIKLGYTQETAEELATSWNKNYANPPLRLSELTATIRSAFRGK